MKKMFNRMLLLFSVFMLISTVFSVSAYYTQKNRVITQDNYEYYTYPRMTKDLKMLQVNCSEIMYLESIGKTYQGRDIWMVKISDNPITNEKEPGVLLMGAHHGNEKPSFEVLIYFIKHLTEFYNKPDTDDDSDGKLNEDIIDGKDNDNDGLIDEDPSEERVRNIINNTQIFVIPMVNPDGVEADTRKNCVPPDGVNLNRNYGYKWELYDLFPQLYGGPWVSDPYSGNYRGEYPFSENETRAVRDFVEQNKINISLSYHSYGEVILYPWMHTSAKTPHEDLFISVGENISKIDGYYLYTGKEYPIPLPGGTLGTSENWLYGTQGILSFTMELCKRRAPTDPDVVHKYLIRHVGVNLYVCERASTVHIDGPPRSKTVQGSFLHVLYLLRQMVHQQF